MISIKQQIIEAKKIREEQKKDFWYVDDCNNCKDIEIRGIYGKEYTPCKHQWYCHHDNGKVQDLEAKIANIKQYGWLHGFTCAYERKLLKKLYNMKFKLVQECKSNSIK